VRDTQKAQASNLILYPSESPRRRPNFALRKIVRTVAAIGRGEAEFLTLGNADAVRDFSHARDVARAAMILGLGAPAGDYICSSGRGRSIREAAETAFRIAKVESAGRIRIDPALLRPNDIPSLVGDNRALRALGWEPAIPFEALVQELLDLG